MFTALYFSYSNSIVECTDRNARELDATAKWKTWLGKGWGLRKIKGLYTFLEKVNSLLLLKQKIPIGWKATEVSSPLTLLMMIASRCILWLIAAVINDTCHGSQWSGCFSIKILLSGISTFLLSLKMKRWRQLLNIFFGRKTLLQLCRPAFWKAWHQLNERAKQMPMCECWDKYRIWKSLGFLLSLWEQRTMYFCWLEKWNTSLFSEDSRGLFGGN